MATWSPTLEGFRAVFRRPSVSFAEMMWRWSFGAAVSLLLGFALLAYLDTLPVSNTDLWMLRSGHPLFFAQAVSHMVHGSALRVVVVSIILFSALALFWIFLGSIGRAATLGPLLEHIRQRAQTFAGSNFAPALAPSSSDNLPANSLRSLAGLRFLRVALAIAAVIASIGALVIASLVSTKNDPHPGIAFLLVTISTFVVWTTWSTLSWFLSTASIFVVRQGQNAFDAILAAVDLFRERTGAVVAVGTWFGTAHLILFLVAAAVVPFPLAFAQLVPPIVVIGVVLLLSLAYFAIVDALHIGRFAGYLAILEAPPAPPPPAPPPPPPIPDAPYAALGIPPETAMVDQDETILSDSSALVEAQGSPSLRAEGERMKQDISTGTSATNPTEATNNEEVRGYSADS